ncbi:hypothetical protein GCM10027299_03140 [Larkinella ripae]
MNDQKSGKRNGTISHQSPVQRDVEHWPAEMIQFTQNSGLISADQTLILPETRPGEYGYLILTIGSLESDATLMLKTDAPNYFQLATDQRPAFKPSLTLQPVIKQTHVHIRYSPDSVGRHSANLTVQTSETMTAIQIVGKSPRTWASSYWLAVPFLLLIGGLAYTFYNRSGQIALVDNQQSTDSVTEQSTGNMPILSEKNWPSISLPALKKPDSHLSSTAPIVKKKAPVEASVKAISKHKSEGVQNEPEKEERQPEIQPLSAISVVATDPEESELERELNKKVRKKQ